MTLLETVRRRYRLQPGVPLHMMEAHHGILLVPLTDVPMRRALAEELGEWQALGAESLTMFPWYRARHVKPDMHNSLRRPAVTLVFHVTAVDNCFIAERLSRVSETILQHIWTTFDVLTERV